MDSQADFLDFQIRGYLGETNSQMKNSRMTTAYWYWQKAEQHKRQLEIKRYQAIKELIERRDADIGSLEKQYQLTPVQVKSLNPKGKYEAELLENIKTVEIEKAKWLEEETPRRLAKWQEKIKIELLAYDIQLQHCEADIAKYKQQYEDAKQG